MTPHLRNRFLLASAAAGLLVESLIITQPAVAATAPHAHHVAALANGWHAMTAADWTRLDAHARSAGNVMVTPSKPDSTPPPDSSGCPSGMTKSGAYSCIDAIKDNGGTGHLVIIRQGTSNNSKAFGYLHSLLDHNLDLDPIEVTIYDNAAGVLSSGTTYRYGAYHTAPKGQTDQYVEVYDNHSSSTSASDTKELGMVTAYCRNSSYTEENVCPDWVNSTL